LPRFHTGQKHQDTKPTLGCFWQHLLLALSYCQSKKKQQKNTKKTAKKKKKKNQTCKEMLANWRKKITPHLF